MVRKKKIRILNVPPKYVKGNLTEEEKSANRKRNSWDWRQNLKAKGWRQRNFYYPAEYHKEIVAFVERCQKEWEERQAEKPE